MQRSSDKSKDGITTHVSLTVIVTENGQYGKQ